MKNTILTALLVSTAFMPVPSYASLTGIWFDNCENPKDGFVLSRSHDSGPYAVLFCASKCIPMPGMKKPTMVYGDPAFDSVNESDIVLKGKNYTKCSDLTLAHFEPLDSKSVEQFLKGTWIQLAKVTGNVESPITGSDLNNKMVVDETSITSTSGNGKKATTMKFKVTDGVIAIVNNGEFISVFEILSVNESKLYLSDVNRPGEAIRVYTRE